METGFIKLYRKMVEWQWYSDNNVFRVFLHLLLTANYKDKKWQNIIVKRGQKVTSVSNISDETGLTIRQVRLALEKLKNSENLTIKTTNKYSLVTIVNYSKYQDVSEQIDKEIDKEMTIECKTNDNQMTTTKEYKEIKKEKNIDNNIPASDKSTALTVKASKHKFGEYKNVLLKDEELQKLKENYANYLDLIKYLDEYIEMKGYKAKSHYLAIKKWVVDAAKKNNKSTTKEVEDWMNE